MPSFVFLRGRLDGVVMTGSGDFGSGLAIAFRFFGIVTARGLAGEAKVFFDFIFENSASESDEDSEDELELELAIFGNSATMRFFKGRRFRVSSSLALKIIFNPFQAEKLNRVKVLYLFIPCVVKLKCVFMTCFILLLKL